MRTLRVTGRPTWLPPAAVAGGLVYAWIAAALRPFTWPENVAVAAPVLVVVVFLGASWGKDQGRRLPDPDAKQDLAQARARRMAGATWIGLVVVLVVWELTAYFSSPRQDHPTLSTVADDIMSSHPGRAAMFALWLALGWVLFVRPRTRPTRPQ